MNATLTIQV